MIRELFVIKSKLIHKVSSHLLDLVVWKCLENTSKDAFSLSISAIYVSHLAHPLYLLQRQFFRERALHIIVRGRPRVSGPDLDKKN